MSYNCFMEWYRNEYPYHNMSGERYNDMLSAWDAAVNNFPQENIEPTSLPFCRRCKAVHLCIMSDDTKTACADFKPCQTKREL